MLSHRASSGIVRLAMCAFVLSCVGCSKPPLFHVVAVTVDTNPANQYKVFLNGQEMGTIAGSGKLEFDAPGHKGETVREMLPALEAKMLFVCGWEKTQSYVDEPGRAEMERARTEHRGAMVHLMIDEYVPPTAPGAIVNNVSIFVDNRGGPEQTIAVGNLKKSVAAGAAERVSLPYWPSCDQAKQVSVNGQVLGTIQEDTKHAGEALSMLLDTSRSRCYREKWQNYAQSGLGFGPASGQEKTIYRPRPLQVMERFPNFFLQPLPDTVQDFGGYTSRTALAEVACR